MPFAGVPEGCRITMPGRRPERPTGSAMIPVTDPPAGLLYEMLLSAKKVVVVCAVFCRFSGALTSYANTARSTSVATPKFGREAGQGSPLVGGGNTRTRT